MDKKLLDQATGTRARPMRRDGSYAEPPPGLTGCDYKLRNGECQWAYHEACKLVDEFRNGGKPRWLSLLGVSGVGKTMLARAIRANCRLGQTWRWHAIMDKLRNRDYGLKHWLSNQKILVVDDVGAGHDTDYSKAYAEELAEERMGKWTVWTSNMLLGDLKTNYSARLASRMQRGGSVVVEFIKTEDYDVR